MKLQNTRNKVTIFGMIITSIIYLFWRVFFTIPFGYGFFALTMGLLLLMVEITGMFEQIIHFYSMADIEEPKIPKVDTNLFPDVDVFIATYNEPSSLLYKTINGCKNMKYPNTERVHIYLCDDSNRKEIKELAKSMNINYITRFDRKGAKAGNLNNAMTKSRSPLVVTFDADMIPMHDFLMTCVPFFVEDLERAKNLEEKEGIEGRKKRENKIGFIQTPQSFYNADLFQYNLFSEERIPNEQDYFYRDIQVARNKNNSVIYGGSNAVISREALDEVGGFYTKVITEDFATGMLIESKGYKCIAISSVHASGLSPEDLRALIKQRKRWARGCIQTGRKLNIIFRKGLTLSQKISYISAIMYWYSPIKRFVYIMAPILFSVFGVVVVKCSILEVLIFWLPMYLFTTKAIKLISRNVRTNKWTNIYETILFPSLLIDIILETFCISQRKFEVTRKSGAKEDKNYQLKQAIPHLILLILLVIGIFKSIKITFNLGTPIYSILLFWLVVNLYNILMSIFFMLGRKVHRKAERFNIETTSTLRFNIGNGLNINDEVINCLTYDISETGVSIIIDNPEYIPYDADVDISIRTERYLSNFKGRIVYVNKVQEKWKYAFIIKNIEGNNYNELLNIIHDRVPDMQRYISKNNSTFDDIRINLLKKRKNLKELNRRLPRISLNKELESNECGKVIIKNFNYEYVLIKVKKKYKNKENLTISLSSNIQLECVLYKDIQNNNKFKEEEFYKRLYKIKNYKSLIKNKEFKVILLEWSKEFKEKKQGKQKESSENEFDEMKYL